MKSYGLRFHIIDWTAKGKEGIYQIVMTVATIYTTYCLLLQTIGASHDRGTVASTRAEEQNEVSILKRYERFSQKFETFTKDATFLCS